MRQRWVRSGGFSFPSVTSLCWLGLKILWLLFLGSGTSSSPVSTPQKKMSSTSKPYSAESFCLMPALKQKHIPIWKLLWWTHMCFLFPKVHDLLEYLIDIFTQGVTYLQWRGTQPRCGSVVSASPGRGKWGPPKRPQESRLHRHRAAPGWRSASLQDETHTCTHTCRLERSIALNNKSLIHRSAPLNWTAVLTNTTQELILQREANGAEQTVACTRNRLHQNPKALKSQWFNKVQKTWLNNITHYINLYLHYHLTNGQYVDVLYEHISLDCTEHMQSFKLITANIQHNFLLCEVILLTCWCFLSVSLPARLYLEQKVTVFTPSKIRAWEWSGYMAPSPDTCSRHNQGWRFSVL